jgi:hypothetical protein
MQKIKFLRKKTLQKQYFYLINKESNEFFGQN